MEATEQGDTDMWTAARPANENNIYRQTECECGRQITYHTGWNHDDDGSAGHHSPEWDDDGRCIHCGEIVYAQNGELHHNNR